MVQRFAVLRYAAASTSCSAWAEVVPYLAYVCDRLPNHGVSPIAFRFC